MEEPSKRVACWLDFICEFDISLEYIKGCNNVVADALSHQIDVNCIYQHEMCPISQLQCITPNEWSSELSKDPCSDTVLVCVNKINDPEISG